MAAVILRCQEGRRAAVTGRAACQRARDIGREQRERERERERERVLPPHPAPLHTDK